MTQDVGAKELSYLGKFTAQKVEGVFPGVGEIPDSLAAWMAHYLRLAVTGVRSEAVADKIGLHLQRFLTLIHERYGHNRISACLKRDVVAWQAALRDEGLAPATVNNHLASLSGFTSWVTAQAPYTFPLGDTAKGIGELCLPPLEPRALRPEQVRSLKNICDRLPRLYQKKGRQWTRSPEVGIHERRRPLRDRAIASVLLSTGLRREELVNLDLAQVVPVTPTALRTARQARILRVRGKGKTDRTVFVSADARSSGAEGAAGNVSTHRHCSRLCANGRRGHTRTICEPGRRQGTHGQMDLVLDGKWRHLFRGCGAP